MIVKGQKINDRYLIIRSIGEGGMANVYLAHDIILDRDVAVKVLRGDLANDDKFVRRFQREALSASSLSHPNIVEMYDVGDDNGIYYIVMEYIEGKTLKQLVKKRGALTLSESIDIIMQLAEGINEAHDAGIIHRDIKPQNIMIKDDGCIKITDFGVAMAMNSTQLTQTNSVMGSVHYLPPEQASGKGCTIRSDIYSIGIVFYELVTGSLPFKGENAVEIALKHMRDKVPKVRDINPQIPQSIENIIVKSTAKNPKNRYVNIDEFKSDLSTTLNDERINEQPIKFEFSENDQDERIVLKKTIKKEEVIEDDDDDEKPNKLLLILIGIFSLIVVGAIVFLLILPMFTKIPEIVIPSVKGLSIAEAEKILKEKGFNVEAKTEKVQDETEKGKVVKTEPSEGRTFKKGTIVIIYESLGKEICTIENYEGANVIEIKTTLELTCKLEVKIEEKEIENVNNYNDQHIVDQSIKPGEKVSENEIIILYVPKILKTYPNMLKEGYTLQDAKDFELKYGIKLEIVYEETSQHAPGLVIKQDRDETKPIIKGAILRITVSKEPPITNDPSDPNEDEKQ